jgi:2,4-dienoyl-CoA reductase-like NADH-dependent reductase (Old Yellow Enzyme family)
LLLDEARESSAHAQDTPEDQIPPLVDPGTAVTRRDNAHSGHAAIARGEADLVAFGAPFLANPDLPARYRKNASLNPPDQTTAELKITPPDQCFTGRMMSLAPLLWHITAIHS